MTMIPALLLQSDTSVGGGGAILAGGITFIVMLAIFAVCVAGAWKVFAKAGQPGWAALVPIYNFYILMKIAGRPAWWLLLCFLPLINIVIFFLVATDLAKAFGKSAMFGVVMLFLLSPIGFLIVGFGDARYVGPATAAA
jgi:uncharacterized membrane protein YhaH (DUF805 family)